ncbi:phosphoribosylformylglycinamidine synthase, purS protein [Candidatus Bathyarchaeota archaeon]|nr:MAG: phosphoribosylformylglycinamidine synthase, purS protein [Candidatus Bathyarchaeota archaeon]
MKYLARVEVSLKPGHTDPEGETTCSLLKELNYPVVEVRVSKVYSIKLDSPTKEDAERMVKEMCIKLLANPVKDDFTFKVEKYE